MITLFTQEEVDAIEHYNIRQESLQEGLQEGTRSRDQLYTTLWKKLSALGRVDEYAEAMDNREKLRTLAEEFGLAL